MANAEFVLITIRKLHCTCTSNDFLIYIIVEGKTVLPGGTRTVPGGRPGICTATFDDLFVVCWGVARADDVTCTCGAGELDDEDWMISCSIACCKDVETDGRLETA